MAVDKVLTSPMDLTSAANPPHPARHECPTPGCDKTFLRKEHLKRHARTHTDVPLYRCSLCQRGFTRNDVLQRHLSRHEHQSKTLGRSGRACDRCHASKIRCDGNVPCATCEKKSIDCKDERDRRISSADTGSSGITSSLSEHQENAVSAEDNFEDSEDSSTHVSKRLQGTNHDFHALADTFRSIISGEESPLSPQTRDTARTTISPDTDQTRSPCTSSAIATSITSDESLAATRDIAFRSPEKDTPFVAKHIESPHIQLYFSDFHVRWPFLHVPSFGEQTEPFMLTGAVTMMGAWLEGSEESIVTAMVLYDRLKTHLSPKMAHLLTKLDVSKPWPLETFQSFLLLIIFGLYRGTELSLSESSIMLHTLVGVLRSIGFFNEEVVASQERPDIFFPYLVIKQESRKRIAASIVKVDAYLSILRNQPPILHQEELHYKIPSSFAEWNAPGLAIFNKRFEENPFKDRTQKSLYQLWQDPSVAMLVEDSQFGICGTQESIWRLNKQRALDPKSPDIQSNRSFIRQAHEAWKYSLDETGNRLISIGDPHPLRSQTIWCYNGMEHHNDKNWMAEVFRRPRTIHFDSLMLYHLQGLHLNGDVQAMTRNARNFKSKRASSPNYASQNPEESLGRWATTEDARRAIWHTANILTYHQCSNFAFTPWTVDPIAHAAVATSALTIWTYIKYSNSICSTCQELDTMNTPVELTDWNPNPIETWVTASGRASICGFELCICNLEELIESYRKCLPIGGRAWKRAEALAPIL